MNALKYKSALIVYYAFKCLLYYRALLLLYLISIYQFPLAFLAKEVTTSEGLIS